LRWNNNGCGGTTARGQGKGQWTPWSSRGGEGKLNKSSILIIIYSRESPLKLLARARQHLAGTGIQRNLEEFGVNTGIPVPKEFLRKIPVTAAKNRNSCNPLQIQNHVPAKKFLQKTQEKKKPSGILFFSVFEPQKQNPVKQE
jgi:hypothetical protein